MLRISALGLIAIGILHILVLGVDAVGQAPGWATGALWTWEHWEPLIDQRDELVVSSAAFWSTIGSFAAPLIVLGSLILWMARHGVTPPRFVGYGLLVWSGLAALTMAPSGFPVLAVITMALSIAIARSAKPVGTAAEA